MGPKQSSSAKVAKVAKVATKVAKVAKVAKVFVPHQPQSAEISCAQRFDPFDFCWKNACLPN